MDDALIGQLKEAMYQFYDDHRMMPDRALMNMATVSAMVNAFHCKYPNAPMIPFTQFRKLLVLGTRVVIDESLSYGQFGFAVIA